MYIINWDQEYKIEGRESILLQYTTVYHPFTEVSDLFNVINVLRFHSLRTAGLVVFAHRPGTTAVLYIASYPDIRGERRRKRTPGTHCLRMRLIAKKSRKIVAAATINFALSSRSLSCGYKSRAALIRGRLLLPRASTKHTHERVIIAYVHMCTSAHAHHITLRYEYN